MKKYAKIITAILIVSMLSIALFACIDPENDTEGKMTLVVLDGENTKEYSIDLSKIPSGDSSKGLMPILAYLKENQGLVYNSLSSDYGEYLTQVNNLKEGNGSYIYIYTDVEEDFDVTQYASQITYKEKQYTNSGVGISLMNIKDGCTIIITIITF